LLHDLGKYRPEFQKMLRGGPKGEQTRHKQAGAAEAADGKRLDVAFAIAGHHVGIPDFADLRHMIQSPGGRDVSGSVWDAASSTNEVGELRHPGPPPFAGNDPLRFDVLTRLLFSCLVDADWQDTSEYKIASRGLTPVPPPPVLDPAASLRNVLDHIRRLPHDGLPDVEGCRAQVLEAALAAAKLAPGLFTMTVPTGGGKTLSSLAFGLAHAKEHGRRRVVYVAPYLTIIEQNARTIRKALGAGGAEVVFEHHSLSEPGQSKDEGETDESTRRAENWSAPVIVTTSVQFFESLFSNRPGACRKLHNLARSVVILDECQTLPPGLIEPTRSLLGQLAEISGGSIVFCTATQPGWTNRKELPGALGEVREIVPAQLKLSERLRRVRVEWPKSRDDMLDWPAVAQRMAEARAALGIVNTRRAALELCEELKKVEGEGVFHLSTTLCPAHRLRVLDDVRARLQKGMPCRLVSTQVVEAGCDIDFPLVLREFGPFEAIVQSAGRCNREGRLNKPDGTPGGRVIVFRSREGKLPADHWYHAGRATLEQFLAGGVVPDLARPEDMDDYFRWLYETGNLDAKGIQPERAARHFAEVARLYKLIEEETIAVVVTGWEGHEQEVKELLQQVRAEPSKHHYRLLAPFQVNLRNYELARGTGWVVEDSGGLKLWNGPYDDLTGLRLEGDLGEKCVV
jgi:CRISPR-associated endonuclease/helicase Cas3